MNELNQGDQRRAKLMQTNHVTVIMWPDSLKPDREDEDCLFVQSAEGGHGSETNTSDIFLQCIYKSTTLSTTAVGAVETETMEWLLQ